MPRTPAHQMVVERLVDKADVVADQLADAVAAAVPSQWRDITDEGCRTVTHGLLRDALACLVDGSTMPPEALVPVHTTAALNRAAGVPCTVTMRAMGAAMSCFVGVVRDEAEVLRCSRAERVAAIAVLSARAPLVVFEIMTVFLAGHGESEVVVATEPESDGPHDVGSRAREVLRLTAQGLTTRQVADELGCSASNVSYHLATMRRRYEAPNRAALLARAHLILGPDDLHREPAPASA